MYVAATWILDMLIPQDPAAYALLTRQVEFVGHPAIYLALDLDSGQLAVYS